MDENCQNCKALESARDYIRWLESRIVWWKKQVDRLEGQKTDIEWKEDE